MVEEALEGLDGVKAVEVYLAQDLFRVDHDPGTISVDAMLKAIADTGFKGRQVEGPEDGDTAGVSVDPAALPDVVRAVFEHAMERGRLVLVDVHGPG
jgi:copper chaperone CopZ